MRTLFYGRAEKPLHDVEMPTVLSPGDSVRFPSGQTMLVRERAWVLGDLESDHYVRVTMAPAKVLTAGEIVRALAAADPLTDVYGLCQFGCDPAEGPHRADCPWRLAVEWVGGA